MDSIYLFIISISLAILGIITLLNSPKQKANLFFFGLTASTIGWIWVNYFSNIAVEIGQAIIFNKLIFVITSLLIYFLYLFSTVYPTDRFSKFKIAKAAILIFTIIVIFLDFSNLLVQGVTLATDHSAVIFGYGIVVYLIHFLMCIVLFTVNIARSYKLAEGVEKLKIQYLLLGVALSLLGAGVTNLVLPIFLSNFDLSNIGPAFLLFFIGFTTISIIRYRLFGVKFIVAQILRSLVLAMVPLLSFYALLYISKQLNLDPYNVQGISIVLIGAFLFSVLYTFILSKSQNVFFGKFVYGAVNPQSVINNYVKDVTLELDIVKLSQKTINLITEIFNIHNVGIFIFKNDAELPTYQNTQGFEHNLIDTRELQEIMSYWQALGEEKILVKGEIKKEAEITENSKSKNILALMEENKTNVIIPLNTKLRLKGLLVLGTREDRRDLKAEEFALLNEVTINASVAISRAVLYEEIQTFNQTLQSKVDAQTKELQQKVLELQEARRKENDMIDIMGHELRTPATVVKLNAQLLDKFNNDITTDPEAYKRYVNRIKTAVENEIKLINTLLSSAKLEGDKIVIDPEEVDIKNEIDMAIHGNEKDANDRYLELKNNTDSNTPNVYADRARVVEILNNLISNGIKYTEKGNVTVSSKYDDNMVEITVSDTGKGISKEDLPRLGQKFFRVSNYIESSKDDPVDIVRPGGTGLGLYVTFNLVKRMGGNITVESELGKGSKFIFTLPRYTGQCDGEKKEESQNMFERLGLKK